MKRTVKIKSLRRLCMGMVTLLVLLNASLAVAQPGPGQGFRMEERGFGGGGMRGSLMNPRVPKRLSLTNEQKQKVDAIRAEMRADLQALKEECVEAKARFFELMKAPHAKKEELREAHNAWHDQNYTFAKRRLEWMLKLRDELDADQLAALSEVMDNREFRMKRQWKERKWFRTQQGGNFSDSQSE